jgi:hypothetical protein
MEVVVPGAAPELNPDAARALLSLLRNLAERASAAGPNRPAKTGGTREENLGGDMRRAS